MSHAVDPAARPGRAGRFGVVATVLLVVLVVGAEFALLTAVYRRGIPVHRQQVVAARLAGRVAPPVGPGTLAAVRADVAALEDAGVSGDDLAGVRTSVDALAQRRPGAVAALGQATGRLEAALADESGSIDDQAEWIYVGLLVAASFGWMAWFRKLVSKHRDLQRRITEQEARAEGEQRLSALVHNSSDVIAVLEPDSTLTFVTPSVSAVLGWQPDELLGRRLLDDVIDPDDAEMFVALLAVSRAGDAAVTVRARTKNNGTVLLEGTLTNLLADGNVGGFVLTTRDITERRSLEDRLSFQAFHDSLTGLANRRLLNDRLEHALVRGGRTVERGVVILFLDLDDFKQINDSRGHGAGDAVLVQVGERLRNSLRPGDTAARLGGDEFAILMEDTDADRALAVAERLLESFAEPIVVDGVTHTVTASIGVADAENVSAGEDLLRNADVAMYLAKDRGKNAIAVYEPHLHAESLERLQLQADLQRALRNDEFVLHYQPAVDLQTGDVVGFEALVRWQRPGHGLVPPIEFIPEAERCGLIVPIGKWVLREACRAAAAMQTETHAPKMSVNVAASQLAADDFVEEVVATIEEAGLAASRLCLEITESALLRELSEVAARLNRLRELGVRVAVDDFGTGYSSLSYLSKLPVDVLKVDKSFVDLVAVNEQDASLTLAILAMSAAMRLTTVAEGIEDAAQADWLASSNCTEGQGYLWSKPVRFEEACALLTGPRAEVGRGRGGPRSTPLRHPHRAREAATGDTVPN